MSFFNDRPIQKGLSIFGGSIVVGLCIFIATLKNIATT